MLVSFDLAACQQIPCTEDRATGTWERVHAAVRAGYSVSLGAEIQLLTQDLAR